MASTMIDLISPVSRNAVQDEVRPAGAIGVSVSKTGFSMVRSIDAIERPLEFDQFAEHCAFKFGIYRNEAFP
jgi:hypothetical protein